MGFNPRARTGRDLEHPQHIIDEIRFNPRARTGRDLAPAVGVSLLTVSIHAPARGATSVAM